MPSNEQVEMLLQRRKNLKRKQFTAKTETDSDERTVTAIISTIAVDRDKEVLLPKGMDFEAYMKNPVVLWAHDYRSPPIGRTLWMKKGRKEIKAKIFFAPRPENHEGEWKPDTIFHLFEGKFLNAFSVGFDPREAHEPTPEEIKKHPEWAEVRRIYDDWELLEFSPVPVPANPEALVIAVKAKELELSDELKDQLGIDDSIMVYADTATDNDSTTGSTDITLTIMPTVFQGEDIDKGQSSAAEPVKLKVHRRPKLKKHSIIKRGYDPNEIRAIAEAKIQGRVYFKR